jgi:signal transduction histidine kinase
MIFIAGIVMVVLQYRKRRIRHEHEKITIEKQHKLDILHSQLQVQHQTMQHIGQEIHDSVAQKLTLASIYTQRMQFGNKLPDAKEALDGISKIINDSLVELKQLSKSLTDTKIQNAGLGELIRTECEQVNATGICTAAYNGDENPVMSIAVKSSLLRITQEFIQNSIKHASCRNIHVILQQLTDKLELQLTDDGKGFDMETVRKGAGLDNIRRRIQSLGGTYSFDSSEIGTKLNLVIPANNSQA